MITLSRRSDITLQAFEAVAWRGDAVTLARKRSTAWR